MHGTTHIHNTAHRPYFSARIHTPMHTHTHILALHTHACTYACNVHAQLRTHSHTQVHSRMHAYMHSCARAQTRTCKHIHAQTGTVNSPGESDDEKQHASGSLFGPDMGSMARGRCCLHAPVCVCVCVCMCMCMAQGTCLCSHELCWLYCCTGRYLGILACGLCALVHCLHAHCACVLHGQPITATRSTMQAQYSLRGSPQPAFQKWQQRFMAAGG